MTFLTLKRLMLFTALLCTVTSTVHSSSVFNTPISQVSGVHVFVLDIKPHCSSEQANFFQLRNGRQAENEL